MDDENNNNNDDSLGLGSGSNPPDQPTWFIDEKTPGIGNRPEWMPEKFKSVFDMAKGYSELEKRVGSTPGAPDAYDFGEYSQLFDKEHSALKGLQDFYKEKRIPQEVLTKTLESISKYADDFSYDEKVEMQKLGENAEKRVELLNNWAKANLSEKSFSALTSSMISADSIMAMEEIRQKMMANTQNPPNGSEGSENGPTYTKEDVELEISENLEKYKTDSKYRTEMRAKLESAAKSSNFVDKLGG